jgi:broad specificity phosphatase PhoE
MTRLHLIRHGRATAAEERYDQLHTQGEQQARLLGEHLARTGRGWDSVYVGPLVRQRETYRLMREAASALGARWPEPIVLDGLAEGPFEALMKNFVRPRLSHDPIVQALAQQIRAQETPEALANALRGLFVHMEELWRSGEVTADDLETAADFEARVLAALEVIRASEGIGREVAAITSSGVIRHLLRHAGLDMEAGGGVPVFNTSVSVLELGLTRVRVSVHNLTEHLSDPALHTLL